jgi:hypothetical protein
MRDAVTAAANLLAPALSIKLGSATASSATLPTPAANTGEHQTFVFQRDVTSYFVSNWSGTSMSAEMGITVTGPVTANHWFKLLITYEYDDASATHIKTVRIPIESTRQYATTTWQTLGGATAIPALSGGWLPENGVTLRQVNIELWGNEGLVTATTDHTLSIRVNGGTQRNVYFGEQALDGNALHFWTNYDATSETTYGSARSLEILTDLNNTFARTGGMVVVTYEFTVSGTTNVMNSLLLGGFEANSFVGGTSGTRDVWSKAFYIEEPGTITLQTSGLCLFVLSSAPGGNSLSVGAGAQTVLAYTMSGTSDLELGQHSIVHRVDSAGLSGTAFATLARGKNEYTANVFSSSLGSFSNLNGFLVLNYTSGVAAGGVGSNAHTIYRTIKPSNSGSSTRNIGTSALTTFAADENSYFWLIDASIEVISENGGAQLNSGVSLNAERNAGEGAGDGYKNLYSGMSGVDSEKICTLRFYSSSGSAFKRHAQDVDTERLDPLTSRNWNFDSYPAHYASFGAWVSYHSIWFTVSGTVSGYTGNGSGIEVDIFRKSGDGREHIGTVTTTTGGNYEFIWFDDTEDVFAVAAQSSTLTGRSADAVAT